MGLLVVDNLTTFEGSTRRLCSHYQLKLHLTRFDDHEIYNNKIVERKCMRDKILYS